MQRLRITYKKYLPFIGHLDIVRLWERALRRTDIDCAYSEGFNPRQKLSFGPPLPLGFLSDCELIDIFCENWQNTNYIKETLNKTLPKGIEITEIRNVFPGLAALTSAIKYAEYMIEFSKQNVADIEEMVSNILRKNDIFSNRKNKIVNLRKMIKDIKLDKGKIIITVQCNIEGTLKGYEIKGLFKDIPISSIKRIGFI